VDSFSVAFICTGNRFRSPLAEAFVRRLTLGLPVQVTSHGILELDASPALPEAVDLARWFGIDLAPHRTRLADGPALSKCDLVVGFERVHVHHAVMNAGAERTRTFMLSELVALLEGSPPPGENDVVGDARLAVEWASRRREQSPARVRGVEVADPFGLPWKAQCALAAEIRELVISLVASLFGVSDVRGLPPLPDKLPPRRRSLRRRLGPR
jgi:protein-tyrosine phosphatase